MSEVNKSNFFHTAIKSACPNVVDISRIKSCAANKPIFLATSHKSDPIVFKFVDSRVAMRDRYVSSRLTKKDIPVPEIKIAGYIAQWYETYKFNPCYTLDEHVKNMLDDNKIFETYKQVLDIQAKIAESSLDDAGNYIGKYFSDVYKITATRSHPKLLVAIYSIIIKYLSQKHNVRLVHNDLNRNNILCNSDGSLNQIIDITGVALASEEFAMISLLSAFPLPDLSEELMDYYDKITKRKLDRKFIYTGLKLIKHKRRFEKLLREINQTLKNKKVK